MYDEMCFGSSSMNSFSYRHNPYDWNVNQINEQNRPSSGLGNGSVLIQTIEPSEQFKIIESKPNYEDYQFTHKRKFRVKFMLSLIKFISWIFRL